MVCRSRRIAAVSLGLASVLSASDVDAQFYRWVDRNVRLASRDASVTMVEDALEEMRASGIRK